MRKQVKYQDDGRVVAPMDVPGMPREGEGAFGLSQRERRAAAWGLLGRFLLSALFCVGASCWRLSRYIFMAALAALHFIFGLISLEENYRERKG